MGKYAPLKEFLVSNPGEHVPMTFAEIEALVGEELPRSKMYPAWWSNNPSNNVMTKEWLAAGYRTESVDIVGEKLVFRRVNPATSPTYPGSVRPLQTHKKGHSLLGCLKGMLKIMPGVDLTQPADPDWDELLDKKHPPVQERQA